MNTKRYLKQLHPQLREEIERAQRLGWTLRTGGGEAAIADRDGVVRWRNTLNKNRHAQSDLNARTDLKRQIDKEVIAQQTEEEKAAMMEAVKQASLGGPPIQPFANHSMDGTNKPVKEEPEEVEAQPAEPEQSKQDILEMAIKASKDYERGTMSIKKRKAVAVEEIDAELERLRKRRQHESHQATLAERLKEECESEIASLKSRLESLRAKAGKATLDANLAWVRAKKIGRQADALREQKREAEKAVEQIPESRVIELREARDFAMASAFEAGWSFAEIGEACGYSEGTPRNAARDHGIPFNAREAGIQKMARASLKEGMPIKEMADTFGIAIGTLRRLLHLELNKEVAA